MIESSDEEKQKELRKLWDTIEEMMESQKNRDIKPSDFIPFSTKPLHNNHRSIVDDYYGRKDEK